MIGKLGKYVAAGIKYAANKSSKYTSAISSKMNKAEDLLFEKTPVLRRIQTGFNKAQESLFTPFDSGDRSQLFTSLKGHIKENLKNGEFMKDEKLYNLVFRYFDGSNFNKINFKQMDSVQLLQAIIEKSGVGTTKLAQIIADNNQIMNGLKNRIFKNSNISHEARQKTWDTLSEALKSCQSKGTPSRTIQEVEDYITKTFGSGYTLRSEKIAVGSIGETCFVTRPDGSNAVIKMLKQGVDKDKLELEEKLYTRLLRSLGGKNDETDKIIGTIKNYYKNWQKELNFNNEFNNNKLLQAGAKRFKVANITEVAKDGRALVMDNAEGIQMEKLFEIMKDYRANPSVFNQKYAKLIEKNPWLANPEQVLKELPKTVLKSFDEQFLFLKQGGKSIMHGDPHMGNYFITIDSKGKLIPEFIDTGNCILRSSDDIQNDIKFFSNYFVGNSRAVAEYFVNACNYTRANKEMVTSNIAKDLQKEIFGKNHNITNFGQVQSSINNILAKHGLNMPDSSATALKAQIQFMSNVSKLSKLAGESMDISTVMKDIPFASYKLYRYGANPIQPLKEALRFAYYNQEQSSSKIFQFVLSKDKLANQMPICA